MHKNMNPTNFRGVQNESAKQLAFGEFGGLRSHLQQPQQQPQRPQHSQQHPQQQRVQRNIIVYASESQICRRLVIAMQSCGLLQLFEQVDVCRPGARIPNGLSEIPTLIISSEDIPLVGQAAFEWVEKRRMLLNQNMNMKKMMSNNIYQWQMLKSNIDGTGKKMLGYSNMEMGGFSDGYALVKDDTNEALPQNFVGWNESISIYTGPEEKKISADQQSILLQNIESRRLEQDSIFKSSSMNVLSQLSGGNILPSQLSADKLVDEKLEQPMQMNQIRMNPMQQMPMQQMPMQQMPMQQMPMQQMPMRPMPMQPVQMNQMSSSDMNRMQRQMQMNQMKMNRNMYNVKDV
jgi:hypothetical protein